ncbi:MAG: hypothetical protein A3I16_08730 [Burkholderiales bacterium RIFCSPLOWO2_02_FULL_66_35]|nr:MAG: hypothetical protein A3I16_08730 [Burkholderiales bacterium RIFCSPLOWO2_02_FULL_66_35]
MDRSDRGRIARFALTAITPIAVAATGQTPGSTGGQKAPSKVSFIDAPSSEKPAAREKRLKRECKGRPNAGMCLGHTR